MNYPNTYRDTFKHIVLNSLSILGVGYELKDFYYGDSRRIEEAMKSKISYPVLWLELPEFVYREAGDNMVKQTAGAFMIISGTAVDDYDKQDDSIELSVRIAEKVIKHLRDNSHFTSGDSINVEPIVTEMTDNCYGCRVTFTIKNQEAELC